MAKSKYSKVDEYGFERPDNFNYELYDDFMSKYMGILIRREQRWSTLKGNKYVKNKKLRRFVRKGVPIGLRTSVWMAISGAQELKNESPVTYHQMRKNISVPGLIDIIEIDLPRTFPENIYFNDQKLMKQLFHVLATFAHQNSDVGYCQGLNYITGLLLLGTKNEEVSFWLLKALVENILPKYTVKNMCGLLVDLDVLDDLIRKVDPQVHRHVHKIGMPWAMATTKWFICLFAEVLPTETVFRIWDCLFYEGSKMIFKVGLTLIKLHRNQILKTKELSELITCFKDFRNHPHVINCHQFMTDVFKMSDTVNDKELFKLRQKHEMTNKKS